MKKNKKNGQKIHMQPLVPSLQDTVALGFAVTDRFIDLCALYLREKHEELAFPSHLDSDVLLWRTMVIRHKKGDFRNTEDELKSTKRIADWTLQVKCALTGQKYKPLDCLIS